MAILTLRLKQPPFCINSIFLLYHVMFLSSIKIPVQAKIKISLEFCTGIFFFKLQIFVLSFYLDMPGRPSPKNFFIIIANDLGKFWDNKKEPCWDLPQPRHCSFKSQMLYYILYNKFFVNHYILCYR